MNCLPLLNLPLRIRPKSISREPKPCSINSRPGRSRKMLKHRPGYKVPKHRACREPGHCPYRSLDRSKPSKLLGHTIRRRKMLRRSCEASAGATD